MIVDPNCPFCELAPTEVVGFAASRVQIILDARPMLEGHCLVVTRAHHKSVLDAPLGDQTAVADAESIIMRRMTAAYGRAASYEHGRGPICSTAGSHLGPIHAHRHIVPLNTDITSSLLQSGWRPVADIRKIPPDGHYFYQNVSGSHSLWATAVAPPSHLVRRMLVLHNTQLKTSPGDAATTIATAAMKLRDATAEAL